MISSLSQIPSGFLKLPLFDNISKEPTDPYDLGTEGMLHAGKFESIINAILKPGGASIEEIKKILEGHYLQNYFDSLSNQEIADFCRHVLLANKSDIGWEIVDDFFAKLKKKYIAIWELPDLKFYRGFKDIFTFMVNWEIKDENVILINEMMKNLDKEESNIINFQDKIEARYKLWNFKDIWLLLLFVIKNSQLIEDQRKITNFIDSFETFLFQEIRNSKYDTYQKSAIILIINTIFLNFERDNVLEFQEIVDTVWRNVEKLSDHEIISFRYLFGSVYSTIAKSLITSNIDFLARRRLLNKILSNFIMAQELNIDNWLKMIINSNTDPIVFNEIFRGYITVIPLIKSHVNELPQSKLRDSLEKILNELPTVFKNALLNYLKKHYNINNFVEYEKNDFIEQIENIESNPIVKFSLKKTLIDITESFLFVSSIEDKLVYEKLADIVESYQEIVLGSQQAEIFKLKYLLKTKKYPFDDIIEKILQEIKDNDSIVLCLSFEEQIIRKTSKIMELLLKENKTTGKIDIENFEFLIYFIGEWINRLYTEDELYIEALMILAPIISICYVQIIRGLYEKQMLKKAFLTYLNMHYFVKLYVDEIKRSSTWGTKKLYNDGHETDISKKYLSLVKEWNIEQFIDLQDIQKSIINIELSFSDNNSSEMSSLSGMLDDDLVLGYLEYTQKLEEFIENESVIDGNESELDRLKNSELYFDPSEDSFNYFELIGITNILENSPVLPFPLIRNINLMSSAISMFPMQIELPKSLKEKHLYDSVNEFLVKKED